MAATGVVTGAYRTKIAAGVNASPSGSYAFDHRAAKFRIGEGGSESVGGSSVPKTPSAALTQLESQGDATLKTFEKNLADSAVTNSANTLTVVCTLTTSEGNGPSPTGTDPKYFELGIFDADDTMIAYLTFDQQTKVSTNAIEHTVTITF